jgi:hypothetical protein
LPGSSSMFNSDPMLTSPNSRTAFGYIHNDVQHDPTRLARELSKDRIGGSPATRRRPGEWHVCPAFSESLLRSYLRAFRSSLDRVVYPRPTTVIARGVVNI